MVVYSFILASCRAVDAGLAVPSAGVASRRCVDREGSPRRGRALCERQLGINLDKYEEIPVEATGDNGHPPISTVRY